MRENISDHDLSGCAGRVDREEEPEQLDYHVGGNEEVLLLRGNAGG